MPFRNQQSVHAGQVRRELGRRHRVVHLWREQIGAVVTETVLALILLKRKRHDGIDAEIRPILDPIDNIEDLADAVPSDVAT